MNASMPSIARMVAAFVGIVLVVGAWILATPPNAGPDEISHRLRGEALAQGSPGTARVEAPNWIVWPDISCFALFGERPASCISTDPAPDGRGEFVTRAYDYPIWGHVTAAAAVRVGSGSTAPYVERAVAAVVPVTLVAVGVVLALRRRALAAALAVAAMTPMAWFTLAVVNPSDLVVAGALLAWVAIGVGPSPLALGTGSAATSWSFAVGIVAVMLPRRDSAFWAAMILIAAALLTRRSVVQLVRSLGRWPAVVVIVAAALTGAWALTSNRQAIGLVGLSVALIALHDGWRWARPRVDVPARTVLDVGAVAAVLVLGGAATASRTLGLADWELTSSVLSETLPNLREAIGAVGTLDALVPWWAALGSAVVVIAVWAASVRVADSAVERRAVVLAPVVLVTAIVSAWVLELARDDTTGTYWQGRYYLPLLMGVVILAGLPMVDRLDAERSRPWSTALVAAAVVVATATFLVAVRRWGVGTSGPWDPSAWNTYGAPASPMLLAATHLAGMALLGGAVLVPPPAPIARPAVSG